MEVNLLFKDVSNTSDKYSKFIVYRPDCPEP